MPQFVLLKFKKVLILVCDEEAIYNTLKYTTRKYVMFVILQFKGHQKCPYSLFYGGQGAAAACVIVISTENEISEQSSNSDHGYLHSLFTNVIMKGMNLTLLQINTNQYDPTLFWVGVLQLV